MIAYTRRVQKVSAVLKKKQVEHFFTIHFNIKAQLQIVFNIISTGFQTFVKSGDQFVHTLFVEGSLQRMQPRPHGVREIFWKSSDRVVIVKRLISRVFLVNYPDQIIGDDSHHAHLSDRH